MLTALRFSRLYAHHSDQALRTPGRAASPGNSRPSTSSGAGFGARFDAALRGGEGSFGGGAGAAVGAGSELDPMAILGGS